MVLHADRRVNVAQIRRELPPDRTDAPQEWRLGTTVDSFTRSRADFDSQGLHLQGNSSTFSFEAAGAAVSAGLLAQPTWSALRISPCHRARAAAQDEERQLP